MTRLQPKSIPLAIGSFPHRDPREALNLIFENFPRVPLWPQLPRVNPKEQMYVQYFEGIPGIRFDQEKQKLIASPQDDEFFIELAESYEHVMNEDYDHFKISPDYARGLYLFLEREEQIRNLKPHWIKGQITGPVSFCMAVTDPQMKMILYDETYTEAVVTILKMKALWQIKELKKIYPEVIMFLDEPYLASYGSSMIALSREKAVFMIKQVVESIFSAEAVPGIHCCGNTDWSILLNSAPGIISMDAYEYGENFLLYSRGVAEFITGGGALALGIVPTSESVENETVSSLMDKLEKFLKQLQKTGLSGERILQQSFISPSCGLGNVPMERANKIIGLTVQLSRAVREKYDMG